MNDGDARKAYRIASATSAGCPFGVRLFSLMKLVTSVSVSGRRNALRPNDLMVSVRQDVWDASQAMNLLLFEPAMTSEAIFSAAER